MEEELEGRERNQEDDVSESSGDQSTIVGDIQPTEARHENSTPRYDTVDGSYQFTLTGYSLAKGIGPGHYFSSGTFAVGGHEWAIYFYPDGKNDDDHSEFVSVFIALCSPSFDVQALFEIILLDRSGNGKHKVHSHFNRQIKSPHTLRYQGSMWGYKRFFRREVLEHSDYLRDDTLELTGRVGVLASSIKPTEILTCKIAPLPEEDSAPQQQGSGDDDSSPEDMEVTGSQSKDGFFDKFKELRLEDELARHYHKLVSIQPPPSIKVSDYSLPERHSSTDTDTSVTLSA